MDSDGDGDPDDCDDCVASGFTADTDDDNDSATCGMEVAMALPGMDEVVHHTRSRQGQSATEASLEILRFHTGAPEHLHKNVNDGVSDSTTTYTATITGSARPGKTNGHRYAGPRATRWRLRRPAPR